MDYNKASYLLLALLFSIAILAKPGVADHSPSGTNATDLIPATCNHTQFSDICISSLQSNPKGRAADLPGLAAISVDVAIAHAEETMSYVKKLKPASSDNGTTMAKCLSDCLEGYDEALYDLRNSIVALKQLLFQTVNVMISGAMTGADTCEAGFNERPGIASPLTERNGYFSMLCSNALAITNLLA